MILVIDNYDSFVHNLARYVRELGYQTYVERNDAKSVEEFVTLDVEAIILSPGPGRPTGAGICNNLIRASAGTPILGVCLGHQCLAEVYGGKVIPSKEPMHGRSSLITHDGEGIFRDVVSPVNVARYHSLSTDISSVEDLIAQAHAADGEIMAMRHTTNPHYGVQFHPESLLTEQGKDIVANFLGLATGGQV